MQCQIEEGEHKCRKYAIVRCCDCGNALCPDHAHECCGEAWCDFCIETHNTDEHEVPAEEVFAA